MGTGTTENKGEEIRSMFDGIAPRYDLLNRVLSLGIDRGWRRRLVKMVRAANPSDVLDIATGTGDVAIALGKAVPSATLTGADVSVKMLEIASSKIAKERLSERIGLVVSEAEAMPFPSGSFDAVTVAFGVRNFHDMERGLAEAARVLRPGGRLYVLEFALPEGRFFGALYKFYFRRVLPFVGGVVSGDRRAYTYLPDSVHEFPYGKRFTELMERAGLAASEPVPLTRGVAYIYTGEKQ